MERPFQVGGTVLKHKVYIHRATDEELFQELRQGTYCNIFAPRQVGKSSLLIRTAERLAQEGIRCVQVDLQGIGTQEVTEEQWFFTLIHTINEEVETPIDIRAFWHQLEELSLNQRLRQILRDQVLPSLPGRVVIFIDEIDLMQALSFSDNFFTLLRSIHEGRVKDPEFAKVTFCLCRVAASGDLIRDHQKTPYNIRKNIRLEDFTLAETLALAPGLETASGNPEELLKAVFAWTNGHPYMTMRLCDLLAEGHGNSTETEQNQVDELVKKYFLIWSRTADQNLSHAANRFDGLEKNNPTLVAQFLETYGKLLHGESVPHPKESKVYWELILTGMAAEKRGAEKDFLQVRNRIFAEVFNLEWVTSKKKKHRLSNDLEKWVESGRSDDFLLRGRALQEVLEWSKTQTDLTVDELDFLSTSLFHEAETDRRQLEEKTRTNRILRRLSAGLLAPTIVAIGLSAFAYAKQWEAIEQKEEAVRLKKIAEETADRLTDANTKLEESTSNEIKAREKAEKNELKAKEQAQTIETQKADLKSKNAELEKSIQNEQTAQREIVTIQTPGERALQPGRGERKR